MPIYDAEWTRKARAIKAEAERDKAVDKVIADEGGPGTMVSAERFFELAADLGLNTGDDE